MNTDNIVMWETLLSIEDWDCFRTLTSRDSKSTSGGTLCIFGSHTIVPISWMCKTQTAVSLSSTESEIISLDAGLRMDGLPALDLSDKVIEVLRSTNIHIQPKHTSVQETDATLHSKAKTQNVKRGKI